MDVRSVVDLTSTVIITAAAVGLFGFYLYDRGRLDVPAERYVEDWREWDDGIRIGRADADMVVDAFMDFTCPHCRSVVPVLDSLLSEFGDDAAIRFHHFPLHDGSYASAVAAECGRRQGRFEGIYRTLYAQQDSLDVKPWASLAGDAGVVDLKAFQSCVELPADSFPAIRNGRRLGEELDVRGTPTIWVNGRLLDRGRSMLVFREMAEELGVPQ